MLIASKLERAADCGSRLEQERPMGNAWRFFSRSLMIISLIIVPLFSETDAFGDDCRKVNNILVLFDASGFMKEKDHYEILLRQMDLFSKAIPLTADGFYNVGLRHYGLKVGMGCNSTESILAIQPWDPERFLNSFPKTVSYGTSALSAGLRAAGDEIASANGKSIIVVIGGGMDSCKADPIKTVEQICRNNPDVEFHTFQVGNSQDGVYFLKGIAQVGKGEYHNVAEFNSPAGWHAWMLKYWVKPCAGSSAISGGVGVPKAFKPIYFDFNSFSVASKNPAISSGNRESLDALANALTQNPNSRVTLKGYSDGKGKPDQNLAVARKRAESVRQFLITVFKIPRSRITVQATGPHQMGAPGTPMHDDYTARRVEIELNQ
ncbi:MAG: OmpA family protein [Desulfomonilaceae bacterium]